MSETAKAIVHVKHNNDGKWAVFISDTCLTGYMPEQDALFYESVVKRPIDAAIDAAVRAERERCAKLCDDLAAEFERQCWQEAEDACNDCAAAIRHRPSSAAEEQE